MTLKPQLVHIHMGRMDNGLPAVNSPDVAIEITIVPCTEYKTRKTSPFYF